MHLLPAAPPRWRPGAALVLPVLSCLLPGVCAQDSGRARDIPGGPIAVHRAAAREVTPDVPAPPAGIRPSLPPHRDPPLPIGRGTEPQPASPPSMLAGASPQALTFFVNRVCKPAGAATAYIGEPSAAINRDIAFQTGNWYAASSIDNGMTWTHVNPYTTFPASDGGFCCDQRTLYVPSRDITVWLLQYVRGANRNRYRIAVARGRDDLKNAVWNYWDWIPEDFGYPVMRWLDFPELAHAQDWLHVAANVYDFANNYVGSVRWRIRLNDLRDRIAAPAWSYATSATLGGSTYRYSQGVTGAKIWYGALIDTTTVRVYEFDEGTGVSTFDNRSVAAWVNTPASAPGPDGRDWAGRSVGRIRGAYGNGNEIGFLYASNVNGAERPQPYTRVSRFRTADRTKIADDDIWNPTSAFLYAAACSNDAGATGAVIALGGGTLHPHSTAFIVPPGGAFAGLTVHPMGAGTHGPAGNQWGDYFTVMRHPLHPCGWIGTGMAQNGGPNDAQSEPRYAWFGDTPNCAPAWVTLTVISTPPVGVPITIAQTDLDGRKNGPTNFARRFAPRQGVTLAAPLQFLAGSVGWVFDRWVVNAVAHPVGQIVVDVPDLGVLPTTADARYVPVRKVDVASANPANGVPITVSLPDLLGAQNGATSLTRYYKDLAAVTLVAPASSGQNPFKRWQLNGVNQPAGVTGLNLTMSRDHVALAEYAVYTPGLLLPYGAGCAGSNGVDTQSATGTPDIGRQLVYTLTGARGSSGAFLMLGADPTNWLGLRLPFSLGPLAPGCTLYASADVQQPVVTSAAGTVAVNVTIPDDAGLIDSHVFTQFWCFDPGANPLSLTFSNAVDLRIGGAR